MNKIKILILFLSLSFAANANDFLKATLIYENGSQLNCYAAFLKDPYQKSISYKLTMAANKQEIKSNELKKIVYYEGADSAEFYYITTYSRVGNKPAAPCWMIKLVSGYATLYCAFSGGYSSYRGNWSGGASQWQSSQDTYTYSCIRPGETYATILAFVAKGGLTVNANTGFKNQASKYFIDYKELSEKIDKKEYTHKDITKVVELYNSWKTN